MDQYSSGGYDPGGIEEDDLYQLSLAYLQRGQWEQALEAVLQLRQKYGNTPEIQSLLQEVSFKATLGDEIEDEPPAVVDQSLAPDPYSDEGYGTEGAEPEETAVENDERYQQSLAYLQRGQWGQASLALLQLQQRYGDIPQVQSLLQEVSFKAALDQESAVPQEESASQRWWERGPPWMRWVVPGLLVLITVVVVVVVSQRPVAPPLASREDEIRLAQFRQQGQFYLAARQYDNAIQAFEGVLVESPDDKDALEGIATAEKKKQLDALYRKALELLEANDWEGALRVIDEIEAQDPDYGGLADERALAEKQLQLQVTYNEAEGAYNRGDWAQALLEYEHLQNLDRSYKKAVVTEHLFEVYVHRGQELVATFAESIDAIREAHELFTNALVIHPGESQVVAERDWAQAYIDGHEAYDMGDWHRAAEALGWLYASRPDYARTVGLLLYEASLRSSQVYEAQGDVGRALIQYQRALVVEGIDHSQAEARIAALTASAAVPDQAPVPGLVPTSVPAPVETPIPDSISTATPPSPGPTEPVPTPVWEPTPSWEYDYSYMGARPNCTRTGVMGVIRDPNGLPVQGIHVRLRNTAGHVWVSSPSDENGRYEIVVTNQPSADTWTITLGTEGQYLSPSYSFRTSLGCVNGLQEYKIDWQRGE